MDAMEMYRRYGLQRPISFYPGIKFNLLLWGGGSFMISGCIFALVTGNTNEKLVGLFGILFFGAALSIMVCAKLNAGSRGILELSKEGIYISYVGCVFPWSDIGSAWISKVKAEGIEHKNVMFLLRNVSYHKSRMTIIGKFLTTLQETFSNGIYDYDSVKFNIPTPLRYGISAEDLVAIINNEVEFKS